MKGNTFRGRGMNVFEGAPYQRGRGLGAVVKALAKIAIPFIKKSIKVGGRYALEDAPEVISDIMRGAKPKAVIKRVAKRGTKKALAKVDDVFG